MTGKLQFFNNDEVPVLERIKNRRMCRDTKKASFYRKGTDNDFVIDNKAVSRRHAVVQIQMEITYV